MDPIKLLGILTFVRSETQPQLGPFFFLEWRKNPFYIKVSWLRRKDCTLQLDYKFEISMK